MCSMIVTETVFLAELHLNLVVYKINYSGRHEHVSDCKQLIGWEHNVLWTDFYHACHIYDIYKDFLFVTVTK